MTGDRVFRIEEELWAPAAVRTRLVAEQTRREMSGGNLREVDAAFAALSQRWHPAMRRLADTRAETIDGVIAKLRIVAASMIDGKPTDYDEDILLLAIADLERLSITVP